MAINQGYATLASLKDFVEVSGTAHDDDLERAVESASRKIDKYAGRIFYDTGSATAKTFRADDPYELDVPDFHTTTGLVVKTDTTADGTYDTTWASDDYQTEPLDPPPGWPWWWITAIDDETFPTGGRRARAQITAQWGWAAVPVDVTQVCLELAAESWKRKDAPFGVAGFGPDGAVRISSSELRVLERIHDFQRVILGAV
jgi:hypothetical protein